jgi:predicted transcriptional regulator
MNNAQIIFSAAQELAENGVIKYTGRILKAVTPEGEEIEIKETEQLHTYKEWQRLGYQVKKGQKAIAKITIWNWTSKKARLTKEEADHINATVINADGSKAQEGDEVQTKGHYYMKEAAFFSESQVEQIKAPELETVDSYVIDENYINNLLAQA